MAKININRARVSGDINVAGRDMTIDANLPMRLAAEERINELRAEVLRAAGEAKLSRDTTETVIGEIDSLPSPTSETQSRSIGILGRIKDILSVAGTVPALVEASAAAIESVQNL